MRGLLWAAAVWAVALVVMAPQGWRAALRSGKLGVTRAQWALILVLLGSHSLAASTTAEEVVANPLALERVIRGGLDAMALLITVTSLIGLLRKRSALRSPGLTSLVLYGGVAAFSALYSIAVIVTVGKVFELIAVIAPILLIALGPDPREHFISTIRLLIKLELALLIVAIVGFFVLPSTFYSSDGRPGFITLRTMSSPYTHFDGLSASAALIFAYSLSSVFLARHSRARLGWGVVAVLATLGVLLTSGRQGLIIWLASAAILLWFHRRTLLLIFIAPAAGLVVWANWTDIWDIFTRNQAAVNVSTLSGRLIWWSVGIEVASSHPLTGFGYGVGGRWAALQQISQDSASSIHNGYLEALLGVGLIGLVLLLIPVARALIWSFRNLAARSNTQYAILIVPLMLHTLVSLGFGGWVNGDLILLACLVGIADVDKLRPIIDGQPRSSASSLTSTAASASSVLEP